MPTFLRPGALLVAAAVCTAGQAAEPYPQRPVTLIVPTAAAGGTDTIARLMADALGKQLGQPFVVENKPGANGVLGVEAGARAAPDGYRLLFTYAASVVVNPGLYRKLPYDPVKDLAPIAQIGRGGNLLLVRPDFPARTLDEFVREVKAHPGKYSYCSWGAGSGGHLAMESLKKQAGIDMLHVPYKGTSPCVQDLAGRQVDAAFGDTSSTIELVKAGRVRALANSGPKRLPMLPDVPTMTEAGYPFTTYSWYGLLAPARTPPEIIERLNAAVQKALVDPEVVRRMRELNFDDLPQTTPAQFGAVIRQDLQDWRGLIRSINLSLD